MSHCDLPQCQGTGCPCVWTQQSRCTTSHLVNAAARRAVQHVTHLHRHAAKQTRPHHCPDYNISESGFMQARESHRAMLADHHESFHSTWGQLLKTGYQNSRFAHQVGFPAAVRGARSRYSQAGCMAAVSALPACSHVFLLVLAASMLWLCLARSSLNCSAFSTLDCSLTLDPAPQDTHASSHVHDLRQ